jgi:hypothetical protein
MDRGEASSGVRGHMRARLGSYLGLAEETVVRALALLRTRKRLDIEGRSVVLRPVAGDAETAREAG